MLSGADPVELVTLVTEGMVMEVDGELVKGVGTVDAAAVMESDLLLSSSSVGVVVFVMELFMLTSVGLGDSYSVGGWTSA